MDKKIGISILKLFMSYMVVVCHFGGGRLSGFSVFAVPCFVLLSFYLTANHFNTFDKKYYINRVKILYYPMVIWTVLYFFSFTIIGYKIEWKEIIYSLTLSSSILCPMLYFNIIMILFTTLFGVIFEVISIKKEIVLVSIILLCLVLQYSGINYHMFNNMQGDYKYTFGRIVELLPLACVGLLVRWYENKRNIGSIIFISGVFAISFYLPSIEGFQYQSIKTFSGAVLLSLMFISIPNINSRVAKYIYSAGKLTKTIYISHWGIGAIVCRVINPHYEFNNKGYLSFIIWSGCMVFAYGINILSKRILFIKYM